MNDAASPLPPEALLVGAEAGFPVVGLGASAGGVQALTRFFQHMPVDSGMAFVVVLHLSPHHASALPEVLQHATTMPVTVVDDAVLLERNRIYVLPPARSIVLNDGYASVRDLQRPHGRQVTVDLFFRSLAAVHRHRAFAVVLSGSGADGAVGITRVKEEGGVTFAQRPDDAEFDAMPRSAVATGVVDWVLPVDEIPAKLVELGANMRAMQLPMADRLGLPAAPPPDGPAAHDAEEALRQVFALLRARTGHDFRSYKRATVLRRIERRMQVTAVPTLPAYRDHLQRQPDEALGLLKDLLIGVTNFFRDVEPFNALQREVLPRLFDQPADPAGLRVWVPGCATGEEAYSLAMQLAELTTERPHATKFSVFATDLDASAIATARSACYPASIEADVSAVRLRRFFDKDTLHYRVRKELRERVLFAVHNLLSDPPFSRLDLISCRNLLIYFDREVHPQVLEVFHFALKPGGYLFLGSAESADAASHLFSVVDKKHRIFRANLVPRGLRLLSPVPPAPAMPLPAADGLPTPPPERRSPTYVNLHARLVEQHSPPSVLVDGSGNVVHLSDRAGRFLRHAGGTPSHQLVQLVHPALRVELRTAIFQAQNTGKSVEARRVRVENDGRSSFVTMIVRPVREPGLGSGFALVLFDEVEDSMAHEVTPADGLSADPVVQQLEEELRHLKDQLQNTVEHAETSTEELKASNEELQAMNEELRSTTEELETSKEELQSINEELITVNHELKAKVEETGKINDDLQNLIASTSIATVFVDRAMSIKRYTPRATELFNLIPGDIGRSLMDIRHRLDYEQLADDATQAFQSLRTMEREVRSADGRWFLARALPYRTTEDVIDGAVLTFVDVSSRRRAEDYVRLVAESMKDYAIVTMDPEGRITSWSKGAERIFGHSEEQAVGQEMAIIFTPEDREAGVPEAEREKARREGRAEDERWHVRRDGERLYCSGVTTPLVVDGQLRGFGKIARDLTQQRLVDAEREAQLKRESAGRERAQSSADLKDEFLAVMSHELKNPLNLIQLNAELLSRLPEAKTVPAVSKAAETIRRTVLSQAQIIDDLLDLSRVRTGKLSLNPQPVDWVPIVQTIADAVRDEAQRKSIRFELVLPPKPLSLRADPVRLEQVVWNLVSNALKFTPAGGRVTVRLQAEGHQAVLSVQDTGRGIAPQALSHVFDMFRQADAGPARRQGGLGIGLALVKSLAEAQGGLVEVQSAGLDLGSTFTVRLPLRAEGARAVPEAADGGWPGLRGCRVLLVDDEPLSVETLTQLLELEGATVVSSTSGADALQRAEHDRFDFVLSDLAMPEMDGYEFVRRLRALPAMRAVPTLALSGMGRPADGQRALAAGFTAHLKKPITLDALLQVLGQVVRQAVHGPRD
ncbi:CheR family methyltransferase [Aquabacterium sp. J223]|uniref:CheR family methyltransferase n=1 Tax=Aquabacterium sp. J223 TaxID=2898431 RepID=UPI0021ADB1C0|nr:CheR family methyltransferase [Aquabacterium sp. J223]UUX95051.1 PAS domain-containing protein [Aquabacterium sp. J223]